MSTLSRKRATRSRGRTALLAGFASVVALSLTLSACETMRVGNNYDRSANFADYHTFTWLPRSEYGVRNPLVIERTREAIQTRLEQKGYTYTSQPDTADFAVDFTVGARQRTNVYVYPAPYGGPWYWYGPRWWGYPYWGTGVDVHRYREGVLSVDVFDARTHRPVWHGWAKKSLTRADMEESGPTIRKAVDAVLADFPPG